MWEDSNLQSQKRADLQSAQLQSRIDLVEDPRLNMTNLYAVGIHISKIHILGLNSALTEFYSQRD